MLYQIQSGEKKDNQFPPINIWQLDADMWDKMDLWPMRYAYATTPYTYTDKQNTDSEKSDKNSKSYQNQLAKEQEKKEKAQLLEQQRSAAVDRLNQNLYLQQNQAKIDNENNLKQLYIAYMQGMKNIPQQAAVWGAGGEIESLKNQRRISYENNRAQENRNYSDILSRLQQQYNEDLYQLEQKYLQSLIGL